MPNTVGRDTEDMQTSDALLRMIRELAEKCATIEELRAALDKIIGRN